VPAARYQLSAFSGQLLNEHCEHAFDLGGLLRQFFVVVGFDQFQVSSQKKVILQLAGWASGNEANRANSASPFLPHPFGQIGWNRSRSPPGPGVGFNEEGGGLSLPLPRSLAASKPQIPGGTSRRRRSYACNATTRDITTRKKTASGRGVRAFNPLSRDDIQLFKAVMAGHHHIRGLSNSDIRASLEDSPHLRDLALNPKKQSAKVSRILNRFHAHKLIAKIPRTRRWRVTDRGKQIMAASLCLRDIAFPELFRKNAAAWVFLQKNKEVTDKESIRFRGVPGVAQRLFESPRVADQHPSLDLDGAIVPLVRRANLTLTSQVNNQNTLAVFEEGLW
jgi:hypothetical protein